MPYRVRIEASSIELVEDDEPVLVLKVTFDPKVFPDLTVDRTIEIVAPAEQLAGVYASAFAAVTANALPAQLQSHRGTGSYSNGYGPRGRLCPD